MQDYGNSYVLGMELPHYCVKPQRLYFNTGFVNVVGFCKVPMVDFEHHIHIWIYKKFVMD